MTHFLSVSLNQPGPSFSGKGKAKEILYATPPPSWYPASVTNDDEEIKLEGAWWGVAGKDESYIAGVPSVPTIASPNASKKRRIVGRKRPRISVPNGYGMSPKTPPLAAVSPVSLKNVVHRSVDKLCEARRVVGQIQDFQRIEAEGGVLPIPRPGEEEERRSREKEERVHRKRKRKSEVTEARQRRQTGGEVGEAEAVMALKKTTASMLAHVGFEGKLLQSERAQSLIDTSS